MTTDSTFASLILVAVLCRCSDTKKDDGPVLIAASPMALGATESAWGASGNCAPSQCSFQDQVPVDDFSDGAGLFAFDTQPPAQGAQYSYVTLKALREGTTTLRARSSNSKTRQDLATQVRVASPDQVKLSGIVCGGRPNRVGTGAVFDVAAKRFYQGVELNGTGGAYPLASGVATPSQDDGTVFTAQASRGTGTVHSVFDSASVPVEVVEPSQVERLAVAFGATLIVSRVGDSFGVYAKAEIGGQALCADAFARDVVAGPASICESDAIVHDSYFGVSATGVGTCTVTVTLTGTSLSASLAVSIQPGPANGLDASAFEAGEASADAKAE